MGNRRRGFYNTNLAANHPGPPALRMPPLPPVKRFETASGVRIYRIALEVLPELTGRVHLVLGAGPPTLVDTGSGEGPSTPQLLAGLEAVGREFGEPFGVGDLARILITHSHVDHIGGLADLRPLCRAEVGVHPLDRRPVTHFDEHAVLMARRVATFFHTAGVPGEDYDRLLKWFGVTKGRVRSVDVTFELHDGDQLDGIRVVHTPGHSPGHVCLAVDDILLSADHILPVTVPQQWPESTAAWTGLGHYLESLARVERVAGLRLALGGHEARISDLYGRIESLKQTQHRRLGRLLDIIQRSAEPLTIAQLARQLYAQAQGFHAFLAVMDAGARVEYLHEHGRLAVANLEEIEGQPQRAARWTLARC